MMDQVAEFNNIAGFMTLDRDLWIAGRYERLQLINLLAIQQRLSDLEQDVNDVVKYERGLVTGETCTPPEKSSATLLTDLEKTIKAYGDAISILAMIKEAESPARHTVQSLKNFAPCSTVATTLSPRWTNGETSSHLFSVATGTRGWFHRFVGKHERLSRVFQEKHQGENRHFSKYSEKKLRNTEFGVVAACLCLIQLLPVLTLTLVSSRAVRLTMVILLIFFVSLLNVLFANTVRVTNFGAIAAYSAIVVVFISQNG
ncbi:hypothetical protein BDV96DRAFT_399039 [Lophiotrema nucula]|uniref:DUF6594 domain-containing protein n=1 Tax=Lophiotrema nucula TaxID=690887 RepID=A0A6A5ZFZ1_9PLEO|nr:hypothetical protein BDV96DRAFT_399039 [Lophiotrema nucula]